MEGWAFLLEEQLNSLSDRRVSCVGLVGVLTMQVVHTPSQPKLLRLQRTTERGVHV